MRAHRAVEVVGAGPGRVGLAIHPLVCGVLVALAGLGCSEWDRDEHQPPNILLIVVDTLRADHVSLYGHTRETTPHLDALARNGAFFRRAYSQSSWTLPAMASLLTGLHPHQHSVGRDPRQVRRFGRLAPEVPTLAEKLRDSGYTTGAVVNNVFLAPEFGLNRGFGDAYDYQGASKGSFRSAEETVDTALAWISRNPSPYFLVVHFMEPHLFYDPPAAVRGRFTGDGEPAVPVPFGTADTLEPILSGRLRLSDAQLEYLSRLYDEEILAVDEAMGRFFKSLETQPRWPETVVIVTADHGEEFFDHGGFEHGHTLYGELTRVPLVIHGPGFALGEIDSVVEHVDVSWGILALAGLSRADMPVGGDLFSRIRRGDEPAEDYSISENTLYGPPRIAYVDGRYRMHHFPLRGTSEVWELDDQGLESVQLTGPELAREVGRMKSTLRARRGHLSPARIEQGPRLSDLELSALKALGYLNTD